MKKQQALSMLVLFMLCLTLVIPAVPTKAAASNSVQMLQQPLDDLDEEVEQSIAESVMPGAVVYIAKHGEVVKHDAYGYAARYTDDQFTEMEEPVAMQEETIFDMASISKLFTATAVMQLWDEGLFELEDPVHWYIPEFTGEGKEEVTIRQLLTHTSGFAPGPSERLYEVEGDRADRLDFVLREPLQQAPGADYVYSDLDYITLGVLIERLSGERQDDFVQRKITEPLGMDDTMYNPPESLKSRIAATEYQPWTNRGLVWGSVHDENAWSLDGLAGQAGIFSSAADLAVFAQVMLENGTYAGEEILSEEAVELMKTNWNEAYPGQDQGLGWELNQSWYMDDLAEHNTLGHTGYTGTSIVVSPNHDSVTILLTNRVHPTRNTVSTNTIRKKVSEKTADAIYAWSAEAMQQMVERLLTREEIDERTARSLNLHLTVVNRFEEKEDQAKVLKHLNRFQHLVDRLQGTEEINEATYQDLQRTADYLIGKWE
ncbi:serine hydrolase domain-containing protein [Oceanobacillus manasiensis]|uniref:serine hydrolase domain-containing protein n=1 Tax=Oceanobacillus manasiensis TaxID=586413 RepID=UPI0005AB7C63|nr:serine hydrolase domain-containing protein [Oceanobacillus manasiensis]